MHYFSDRPRSHTFNLPTPYPPPPPPRLSMPCLPPPPPTKVQHRHLQHVVVRLTCCSCAWCRSSMRCLRTYMWTTSTHQPISRPGLRCTQSRLTTSCYPQHTLSCCATAAQVTVFSCNPTQKHLKLLGMVSMFSSAFAAQQHSMLPDQQYYQRSCIASCHLLNSTCLMTQW